MLYLATASGPRARDAMRQGLLAQMLTYKAGNRLVDGAEFAIDNGVVKLVDGRPVTDPDWSADRWLAHLERHAGIPGCLFAVVPDEVCDSAATDAKWAEWAPVVRALGYRPAYVVQNGCQAIPADADVVFVGGDDEWKLSTAVQRLVRAAKARGVWCHMGRVNSRMRLRKAAMDEYDSADGTYLAFGPDRNLPKLLGWLYPQAPNLWGVA